MPNPKKTEDVKNLQGNPGKRKSESWDNANFCDNQGKTFGIPKGLPKVVLRDVRKFAKYLEEKSVAVDIHKGRFTRYCNFLRFAYIAEQDLKIAKKLTEEGRDGLKKHPAVQIYKEYSDSASKIEDFFTTLLSKAKKTDDEVDPLEAWLAGGQEIHAVK